MSIISSFDATERGRCLRRLLLALVVCCCTAAVQANTASWQTPALVAERGERWQLAGSGVLRWFGFRVYDAALWVEGDARWSPLRPFALEIRYHRKIAGAKLVQASLDEMRRLGSADEDDLARWRVKLEAAFPDVESGDVIIGLREADGSVAFHHRGQVTVRIEDLAFANAFFAIWLDDRTREPGLRAELIGGGDG